VKSAKGHLQPKNQC